MSESTNKFVSKAATAAIVGLSVAAIAAELVPAMLMGVAVSFAPDFRKMLGRTRCELLPQSEKLLPAAPEV